MIRTINWITTNKCNCRCIHCDIWQSKGIIMPSLPYIRKFFKQPIMKKSYNYYGREFDIGIGGGEPFLLDNLKEIVDEIEKIFPGSFKSISTNGILKDKIIDFIINTRCYKYKINISIDGISKIHNKIRGTKNAFELTMQTILEIRRRFASQKIELKLTLLPDNYDQIIPVYALAKKLGVDFTFKPAENLKIYTNRNSDIKLDFSLEQLCHIRNEAFLISDKMRACGKHALSLFMRDIPFYMFSKKMPQKCSVLEKDITVMPNGEIYTCLMNASKVRLTKNKIVNNSDLSDKTCPSCMLMCGSYKDYHGRMTAEKTANIEITTNCNLDCEMCSQKEIKNKYTDMPFNLFQKIIHSYPDISHVSFLGGEPFLNPNLLSMLSFLDLKGITYEITTNSTLLSASTINKLKFCAGLKKINISIDGLEKYHDSIRGDGVFKKCQNMITALINDFNVTVCTVLKDDNINDIPKLLNNLSGLGVKNYKIISCMSLSEQDRAKTKLIFPQIIIQGPKTNKTIRHWNKTKNLICYLNTVAKTRRFNISFEPPWMLDSILSKDRSTLNYETFTCKQLSQYRFNALGERIICEFIRNKFKEESPYILKLNKTLLPICRTCCKLI